MEGATANQLLSHELTIRCRKPFAATIFNQGTRFVWFLKAAVNVIKNYLFRP
jgi:hypothetical protein